jgi:hypothetical protein
LKAFPLHHDVDNPSEEGTAEDRPRSGFLVPLKGLFVWVVFVVFFLNGCAALTEGKFVGRNGKESPFKSERDPYAFPQDPTAARP